MSIDHFQHSLRHILSAFFFAAISLYGCEAPQDSTQPAVAAPEKSMVIMQESANRQEPVATVIDARPAAMIDGAMVTWGDLRPAMTEAAGAQALHDFIIDQQLAKALKKAAITITDKDVSDEQHMLVQSLNDDPNVALRALDELRSREGIGTNRFNALLRRNAGLRKLVQSQVDVSDVAAERMYDVMHGPKRQARIITTHDLPTAQAARNRIMNGELFADVATAVSTDPSAPRGGLLEPVARQDAAYPESFRESLFSLATGEVSQPLLLDSSYAMLTLVRETPGDGVPFTQVRADLRNLCRLQQERVLMDQLARSYLRNSAISIFDPALKESWDRWRVAPSVQ
ncbi:MAG TPA: peptidylprolyl isomerase [Phycisphaerales bacterium]|nr:peptidylprolyl isomerase [Phycisphaerales bacterium]